MEQNMSHSHALYLEVDGIREGEDIIPKNKSQQLQDKGIYRELTPDPIRRESCSPPKCCRQGGIL